MFSTVKKLVSDQFETMKKSKARLLAVDVNLDEIWEVYLNGFSEETRQEHRCNCCRAFIRQIGNVVIIDPDTLALRTIWDVLGVPEEYAASIAALRAYVASRPIKGLFYHIAEKNKPSGEVGTDQNFSEKHQTIFRHYHVKIPATSQGNLATVSSEVRGSADVLKRGLTEITHEALDNVLELIDQNSLYRGTEQKHLVQGLKDMKKKFEDTPEVLQDSFVWNCATTLGAATCRTRNTSIGTLLIDLSEGKPLDAAVGAFEKIMAPANYKRPTALVTPKMVEKAKEELTNLGMVSALSRRRLDTRDLGPHNALYVHRPSLVVKDVFASLTGEPTVQAKELTKVEEVTVDHFLEKILPTAKGLRALVENNHLPNFATLTGAVDPEAPNLFKWESSFGWSYAGGVAASMRERVRAAGGSVTGVLRFTHSWNWDDDKPNKSLMDLHVFMPGSKFSDTSSYKTPCIGRRVGWDCRQDTQSGGVQDVDYVHAAPTGFCPIENITFPSLARMPEGTYTFKVHNWALRKPTQSGFQAEIEFGGQIFKYQYEKPLGNKEWVTVAEAELKGGEFTIKHHLTPQNPNTTRWGVTTNQWRTVKAITLSPNHWGERAAGLKHHFFILDGCASDEKTRGFYNEFLHEKLQAHRKVTELLADKVEVVPAEGQELSGLGFSGDERNSLLVEVEGSFKRIVKVLF
jgi:hypothetical protein